MTYLERAIADGYVEVTNGGKRQKIRYIALNHIENYSDPEEQVRAEFWAELIYVYGYEPKRIGIEIVVPDRTPSDRADLVVFRDDERKRPFAVIECKRDGISDSEFNQAIEQAVGNGTWAKFRADYVMVVAGVTRRAFDFTGEYANATLEREKNIIADLPKQYGKPEEYKYHKATSLDIKTVNQETLIAAIRKSHQTLWGSGKLSPPTAFGELCKLIFVKISDEKAKRKPGEPYEFQIKTHETNQRLAGRIKALYNKQQEKEPDVFTDTIRIDDATLRTVVSHLEAINLAETDLDTKGLAFEQFMDSFFKGDFGQYFTPRQIIQFTVDMLHPTNDDLVIDPACGSGGFLLYALDAVRREADDYYPDHETDPRQSRQHRDHWHEFALKNLYGIDINDEIARVAKMNMIIHDDGHTNVICADALENAEYLTKFNPNFGDARFDVVLTNPPFGGQVAINQRPHFVKEYDLVVQKEKGGKEIPRKNQKTEIMFIERIWYLLKPGTGRVAIIVPDGVLTNSSLQYVRDWILEHFQLKAVVSLPQTAFAYYGASVKTSILFLRKRGNNEIPNDKELIFIAAPEKIGYDTTGRKIPNQLPDIVQLYRAFEKDVETFFAQVASEDSNLTFTVALKDAKKRFDNHFHRPDFRKLTDLIRTKPYAKLGDLVEFSSEVWNSANAGAETFQYIEINGIDLQSGKIAPVELPVSQAPSRARMIVRTGDIIVSLTRPHRGAIAMIGNGFNEYITSTGFAVIRAVKDERITPFYLWCVLRSKVCLQQMLQRSSGGNYPAITEEELKEILIPVPEPDIQNRIIERVVAHQQKAQQLLKEAETEFSTARLYLEHALLGGE
jgi:type I restriction enzyme M protein